MKHNILLKFLIHFGKGKPAGTNASSWCKELSHLHLSSYNIARVENWLLSKLQSSLSNSDVKIPHHHCTVRDGTFNSFQVGRQWWSNRMRFINIIKAISKFTAFQLLNHRHTLLPRAPRNENKAIRTLWKQIKMTFQSRCFHTEAGKNTSISRPPHGRRAIPTQPAPWQHEGKLTFLNDRYSYGLYLANAATPRISQPFNSFNVTFPKNPPPPFFFF